jgi:NAD(P)H dehydrogenase (quinone)
VTAQLVALPLRLSPQGLVAITADRGVVATPMPPERRGAARAAEELADKAGNRVHRQLRGARRPGGDAAESLQTFHHWGSIILPAGYVNYDVSHAAGGDPYGVSEVESRTGRDPGYGKAVQEAARHQGARLARTAAALVAARAGL